MPNLNEEDTIKTFHENVDEICEKLIAAFALTHAKTADSNLHEALLRWLDFRLRYIEPRPRRIVVSKKFPLSLPSDVSNALSAFEKAVMSGDDVNAYQSTSLTRFNDTSGTKKQKRTDGLWADWGIHHIHLTTTAVPIGQAYSQRSDWLLFLVVFPDVVAFIDVRKHEEDDLFQLHDLVETLIRSFPDYAEQFKLKGALGLANSTTPTPKDTALLRKSGVAQLIELNGAVYAPPGMGITTAATSTRVSLARNNVRRWTRDIARFAIRPDGQISTELREADTLRANLEIALIPEGELAIVESTSLRAWRLPGIDSAGGSSAFAVWHSLLLPEWAGKRLYAYWTSQGNA